jgi:ankyrin repeat protein
MHEKMKRQPTKQIRIAWVSDNGHTDIVKLLLAPPNIDIDKQDDWGDTGEARAREKGHSAIVTFLHQHNQTQRACTTLAAGREHVFLLKKYTGGR